jgi:hypothetical protein
MTLILDTDTRQMRKSPTGHYRSGAGKLICDHCGHRSDCVLQVRDLCEFFLPALPFTVETGLDRLSNTMRVGKAWTERLAPGQTVALYNSKVKLIFGHSRVLYTVAGPIVSMLSEHAFANHIMLDTPKNEAAVKLGGWMRQNYGPRIIHENTTLTAIYLLRVGRSPASPDLQGLEANGPGRGGSPGEGQAGRE